MESERRYAPGFLLLCVLLGALLAVNLVTGSTRIPLRELLPGN